MSILNLEPAARRAAELIAGVTDDQLDGPTPCQEYSLGDLVDHVRTFALAFTDAATKTPPDPDAKPSGDASRLGSDWRTEIGENLSALATAWKDPKAWTGMTQAGPFELPGSIAGVVALDELVLHGWDIAVASGQDYSEVDPATLEVVHGFVLQSVSEDPSGDPDHGLFGAPVKVPDDAPLFDRILGLAGRDPAWSPDS